ncbi:hypothetical protein RclHR1_15090003 [Rhizophagus clarus]|uniref:F-box domain-containing protein n=1 Tax=Rhizophagus clarus TaxID=94130 RepID=A0A2Z6QTI5_9GLOM|nr:hypothetical protein RclHR1_15090003 [Rhizophagus clarus]GES77275.1 hypothetical protein GLOIN_2v1784962 [Rhizophagus clarus]
MAKLNSDVLYLIFKELRDDKKTFVSCLTVDKTWCETIIPILWTNPWKYLKRKKLFLNVIFSHLSDDSRNYLKNQGIDFLTNSYQKPLFNYINFCKHLNFNNLSQMTDSSVLTIKHIPQFSTIRKIIMKEIIDLFINENTRLTHVYIPFRFNCQIHLIPGAKYCFSELEFLSCNTCINDDVLFGLTEICKSIKGLELIVEKNNSNYGIAKLVESPKKLFNVRLLVEKCSKFDEPFCQILENSLIKHANTIQDFKITKEPTTKILSSFVNLYKLELGKSHFQRTPWNCLENLSLPLLQILKAEGIPIKVLTNLIKNTNGYLFEINIDDIFHNEIDNEEIIEAIYQKCPNLKYLKLTVRSSNILEFEKLLINCQYLHGLYIIVENNFWNLDSDEMFYWDHLFEILTNSSPISLFKFKFYFYNVFHLHSLKLLFDKWKNRDSMLLQTIQNNNFAVSNIGMKYFNLIDEYKMQGIVKRYDHAFCVSAFADFEWI